MPRTAERLADALARLAVRVDGVAVIVVLPQVDRGRTAAVQGALPQGPGDRVAADENRAASGSGAHALQIEGLFAALLVLQEPALIGHPSVEVDDVGGPFADEAQRRLGGRRPQPGDAHLPAVPQHGQLQRLPPLVRGKESALPRADGVG